MIQIKLIRNIKRKNLIKEYEAKYKNIETLKKLIQEKPEDVNLDLDLDEWKYSLDHLEENLEETKIIYNPKFSANDLEILDIIKNEKPKSITQLAEIIDKDISNVQRKINNLKDEGLIELSTGKINNIKTPVFNYDKIEINI